MEQTIPDNDEARVYRMSFMAYVRPVCIFVVAMCFSYALSQSKHAAVSIIGYVLIILTLINLYCSITYVKTLKLYLNQDGVFLYRGIFPWTKGVIGTMWRDISDANYYTGFVSWATKSYRVRVGHRFTKTSEIFIPHVKNGNNAVIEINEIIKQKARSNIN